MKRLLIIFAAGAAALVSSCTVRSSFAERYRPINDGWDLYRDSVKVASVNLPHDFSMMPLQGRDSAGVKVGPFTKASEGGNHTGFFKGGTATYKKTLTIAEADKGKHFTILFDGAYMQTTVYVNGDSVCSHNNGYTPFFFDATSHLKVPGENVIEVRVSNKGKNSRWYSGSGIFRGMRLVATNEVHVRPRGIYVTTSEITPKKATVDVGASVVGDADKLIVKILNQKRRKVASEVISSSSGKPLTIRNPHLWSPEDPYLYTALVEVYKDDKVVDEYEQPFGIRTVEFSADKGLLLNGKPYILRGGCVHHDNGLLGSAAIPAAERRKVTLLKNNGFNAVRTSHNPPSDEFLMACDELGMLVIDEFTDMWNIAKTPDDYSKFFDKCWEEDLDNMIYRDRTHPCIIMWSIGNEIPKKSLESGAEIAHAMKNSVKSIDPSRPVTEAVPEFLVPGGWENSEKFFEELDVCGYNYLWKKYRTDHQKYPKRIMYGSETYPMEAWENWKAAEELPYVIGDFVWTAMDYLGEVFLANTTYEDPAPAKKDQLPPVQMPKEAFDATKIYERINAYTEANPVWPGFVSWCGDIDIIGNKKPQGLYRDVLWDRSVIEVNVHEPIPAGKVEKISAWGWPAEYPHWNWNAGDSLQVRVFTKAPQVRLELNGKPVGEGRTDEKFIATFKVPYEAGTLSAVALMGGKEVGRRDLTTTGEAVSLHLSPDKSVVKSGVGDLVYFSIEAKDSKGNIVPVNVPDVKITVDGQGEMVASGNACPFDMASVNRSTISLWHGLGQVVVRPTGKDGMIDVSVSCPKLSSSSRSVKVE